jgi:hypothetical protein
MVEDGELELPEGTHPLLETVRTLARRIEEQEAEISEVEKE